MIVEVPLHLWALPGKPDPADLHAALTAAYAGERFVEVVSEAECAALQGRGLAPAAMRRDLDPEALNGSNRMKLFVFHAKRTAARLGWWPCSTIWERARLARRCRTST